MADQGGRGPNLRPNKKRPGPPSPSGTDPKRPRTAPHRSTPEGTHAPGMATEKPPDQPSSSTHSNRNPEVIRPHLPPHQRDGEDTSAALVPQHMLPQRFDFFLAPGIRESIATQNEERLGMMIERIQRGQVEGFFFDRQRLVWTWEGMQDDLTRAAQADRTAASNQQHTQMNAENPYDSEDQSPEGPFPEDEVSDPDVVPKHVINAMEEAVSQCSVLAANWDDLLATLEGSPTYGELKDTLELVGSNITTTLEICFERTAKGNWRDNAQRLTAMKEFPRHVVRVGGAMTYDQEGKADVLRDCSSFRGQLHTDLVSVWSAIYDARNILADVHVDDFRLIFLIMRAFYLSPACRDQVNLRDRLVDLLRGPIPTDQPA